MSKEHLISDTMTMSTRVMKHSLRSVDTIITTILTPIMLMLAFVYIFGSAMTMDKAEYVNFIVPGVLLMCIGMGISYTAVRVNMDMTRGIFDRFHSMPIAKSSILGGHVISTLLLNLLSVAAVILISFLMGFRPHANFVEWLLAIGMILITIFAFTWMAVAFGLMAKSYEGASVFSYLLMGLMFVSSAFVPTNNMGSKLRAFAENQPMTPLAESVRSLLAGQPNYGDLLTAVIWLVGIGILFYLISMKVYKKRMK
ncbi:ABC transporter permease [Gottfriedia solisilvae]|uniref:Transport permease protein n=1 Tax=Gottfriedia solisilvae TaxID=1516104 RepID=A0A8J3ANV1_9BACI|nr:ABC transporter permease [Gottfriedia solisilvae]GGI16119.1 transport permease protein [Gottfriedia solisilvae]